jgi:hypothetical protein
MPRLQQPSERKKHRQTAGSNDAAVAVHMNLWLSSEHTTSRRVPNSALDSEPA